MTTIFLPNPRLSDDMKVLKQPQWERLRLWFELRHRFLGELLPETFMPEPGQHDIGAEPALAQH